VDTSRVGLEILKQVENALAEKETLEQKLQTYRKRTGADGSLGSFSHERLQQLKEAGFVLNFYACNLRKFDQEWEVLYNAFEIDTVGSTRYFVTVTRPEEIVEIDADPIKLANYTAEQLDVQILEIRAKIEEVKAGLVEMSLRDYNTLKITQEDVLGKIDFDKVLLNTHSSAEEKVMLLEGWCPEESEEPLNAYLEESGVYYETTEPTEEDKVPVKLKNNRFARLYEMIGDLYDIPNYHEIDLTPFFCAVLHVIFWFMSWRRRLWFIISTDCYFCA